MNLLLALERVAAAVAAEEPGLLGAALGARELGLGGRVGAHSTTPTPRHHTHTGHIAPYFRGK